MPQRLRDALADYILTRWSNSTGMLAAPYRHYTSTTEEPTFVTFLLYLPVVSSKECIGRWTHHETRVAVSWCVLNQVGLWRAIQRSLCILSVVERRATSTGVHHYCLTIVTMWWCLTLDFAQFAWLYGSINLSPILSGHRSTTTVLLLYFAISDEFRYVLHALIVCCVCCRFDACVHFAGKKAVGESV